MTITPFCAQPTLSVIIPTHNREIYLAQAIESALRVAGGVSDLVQVEVLVVDDGSTDGTADVVAGYPVRYLRNPGRGVSAARNAGITAASGEFVAFLDDDDIWLDGHLRPHLEVLLTTPNVALVYAQGMLSDANLTPVYPPAPAEPLPSGDIFAALLRQCMTFNTIVARKSVLLEVGAFDETLTCAEDWDLELRVAARHDCVGVPLPVSLYRQNDATFRGYANWSSHYRQTMDVVRRGARLRARRPLSRRQRLFLTFAIRGWFAYRFLHSAQVGLATGHRWDAARCLLGALTVSPVHACFRLPGYWQSVVTLLLPRRGVRSAT